MSPVDISFGHHSSVMLAICLAGFFGSAVPDVDLIIENGRFAKPSVSIPIGARLHFINHDKIEYTVESPGAFAGDVLLESKSQATVSLVRSGTFVAMIEERPDSVVQIEAAVDDTAITPAEAPFDVAKAVGQQPLDSNGHEPAYGAITQFNLIVKGEKERQQVLIDIYRLQEELSGEKAPVEFSPFFTVGEWSKLRSSIALVYGLGPGAYTRARFGNEVAAAKPKGLINVPAGLLPGMPQAKGQHDVFVRVSSDSAWFNLRVCRTLWKILQGRIANPTLEWGYAGPNGRSPILGGFYDGTSNPTGSARSKAMYAKDGTAMLACFRIQFDEDGFLAQTQKLREHAIGRKQETGEQIKTAAETAHRMRASDGRSTIVRVPLIFDDGLRGTGLLFLSLQHSFEPLETLLRKMSHPSSKGSDELMHFMHFESAGYYAIPPSPKGGYPGSLRTNAFTFGS